MQQDPWPAHLNDRRAKEGSSGRVEMMTRVLKKLGLPILAVAAILMSGCDYYGYGAYGYPYGYGYAYPYYGGGYYGGFWGGYNGHVWGGHSYGGGFHGHDGFHG